MNDRETVEAARQGDERAFADLVKRHSLGLHRTVARVLCDDTEAWDVVQMAFLKAWERLDRYDPKWSFATWLYRIGTNVAIDLLRSRRSREKTHQAGAEHHLRLVGEPCPTVELAETNDIQAVVSELLNDLSPQQRSAFVLREIEGLDSTEVAAILGCSSTTVRNHVFQARKVLRREMRERFPEYCPAAERGHDAL